MVDLVLVEAMQRWISIAAHLSIPSNQLNLCFRKLKFSERRVRGNCVSQAVSSLH